MPLLAVGHPQYWRGVAGPPPPPPGGSAKGGYPAWQTAIVVGSLLLILFMG